MADRRLRQVLAAGLLIAAGLGPGRKAPGQGPELGGPVAPPKGIAVLNPAGADTEILSIVPSGRHVKKGEKVGSLDPVILNDLLAAQRNAIAAKKAVQDVARDAREKADRDLRQYVDVTSPNELRVAKQKLSLVEGERQRVERILEQSKQARGKGVLANSQVTATELALQRVKVKEQQERGSLDILVKFTQTRNAKRLKGAVEKAKVEELNRALAVENEKDRAKRLEAQIKACEVVAPVAGTVVYESPIEEGASLRKNQLLFRVVPDPAPEPARPPSPAPVVEITPVKTP